MEEPRRTIEELVTLHELDPDFQEVITEGRTDSGIVSWFLGANGRYDVAVYAISDRLEVDGLEVLRLNLPVGNRGRVIAAASICDRSSIARKNVTFVVDSDFELAYGKGRCAYECLLYTDVSAIELYCFDKDVLRKLLKVTLRSSLDLDPLTILDAISDLLIDLAIVRYILAAAPGSPSLVKNVDRRCTNDDGRLSIDIRQLVYDSVNACPVPEARTLNVEDLLDQHFALKSKYDGDVRRIANGHDFVRALCLYLRRAHGHLFREDRAAYKHEPVFARALLTCLEVSQLMPFRLFAKLLDRTRRRPSTSANAEDLPD